MKTKYFFPILALLFLSLMGTKAQACNPIGNYTSSTTYAINGRPTATSGHLVQTTIITGSSPGMAGCTTGQVFHTPTIVQKAGAFTNTWTGPSVCGTCYVNYTAVQDTIEPIGSPFQINDSAVIHCNFAGAIASIFTSIQTELAFTEAKRVGAATCVTALGVTVCKQPIVPWCTAPSSPPDFYPTQVIYDQTDVFTTFSSVGGYTLGFAVCNRSLTGSGKWGCPIPGLPPVGTFENDPLAERLAFGNFPLQPCTHTP